MNVQETDRLMLGIKRNAGWQQWLVIIGPFFSLIFLQLNIKPEIVTETFDFSKLVFELAI